ncbi:hypothetical protein Celaphus_00014995, partial [Cervus elaphus hippelaphus]
MVTMMKMQRTPSLAETTSEHPKVQVHLSPRFNGVQTYDPKQNSALQCAQEPSATVTGNPKQKRRRVLAAEKKKKPDEQRLIETELAEAAQEDSMLKNEITVFTDKNRRCRHRGVCRFLSQHGSRITSP